MSAVDRYAMEELANKPGAGNPKYLATAISFTAKLEDSLTEVTTGPIFGTRFTHRYHFWRSIQTHFW